MTAPAIGACSPATTVAGAPSARYGASPSPSRRRTTTSTGPLTIAGLAFTASQSTVGATAAGEDPEACSYTSRWAGVWYRYTPARSGRLTATTLGSGYDTVLSVWIGARGALAAVACNDDYGGFSSLVSFAVEAGTTYYIEVAGFSDATGFLQLTVTQDCYAPEAPALVEPADGSTIALSASGMDWSDVSGAAGYQLQVDGDAAFTSPGIEAVVTRSSLALGAHLPTGTYYWRVRALGGCGTSDWSTVAGFSSQAGAPWLAQYSTFVPLLAR
ncbi:MAG: hypothetical protein ACYC5O_02875 [Anaerolineae bacterium]